MNRLELFVSTGGEILDEDDPRDGRRSVLIVQPDGPVRRAFAAVLSRDGYAVRETDAGDSLFDAFGSSVVLPRAVCPFDLVWTRTGLVDQTTVEAIEALRATPWRNPVVFVTALVGARAPTDRDVQSAVHDDWRELIFARTMVRQLIGPAQAPPVN